MTDELVQALAVVGLRPKIAKAQWICDDLESAIERGDCLIVEGVAVKPCKHIKVLGSMISGDGSEKAAYLHRVQQSWKTYFLWKRVLESCADIHSRVLVWKATVMRSMQWALETTRQTQENSEILNVAQRSMFRRMLKLKRRPLTVASDNQPAIIESWLDWQIRTFQAASKLVRDTKSCVSVSLEEAKLSWIFHVGRFGTGPRENHLVKNLLIWRNLEWWNKKKCYNKAGKCPLFHPKAVRPRRFEDSLPIKLLALSSKSGS